MQTRRAKPAHRKHRRASGLILLLALAAFSAHFIKPVAAQSGPKETELTPSAKKYLVTTGVNLRAEPRTKSPVLGKYRRNSIVLSPGKSKGTEWVAITENGNLLGYIFGTALAPMIDGKLDREMIGKLSAENAPDCRFRLRFERRSKVEGARQQTADYESRFSCRIGGKTAEFMATMFITELPYQDNRRAVYQINVDLLDVELEEEDVLSAISLYNADKSRLTFDSLNDAAMSNGKKFEPKKADDVAEALIGAIEFAHGIWGPKVWASLKPN